MQGWTEKKIKTSSNQGWKALKPSFLEQKDFETKALSLCHTKK